MPQTLARINLVYDSNTLESCYFGNTKPNKAKKPNALVFKAKKVLNTGYLGL